MIARIRSMANRVAELLWRNPMLRWRWQTESAYTLNNFIIGGMIAAALFFAWVRWDGLANAKGFVSRLPVELQPKEHKALVDPEGILTYASSYREQTAFMYQVRLIDAYLVYFACSILATSWRVRRKYGDLLDEEQLILPVRISQRLLAFWDWPVIKLALGLVILLGTLLLPSRIVMFDLFGLLVIPFRPWNLIAPGVLAGAGLLALHRLVQVSFLRTTLLPRRGIVLSIILAGFVVGATGGFSYWMGTTEMQYENLRDKILFSGIWIANACLLWSTFRVYPMIERREKHT